MLSIGKLAVGHADYYLEQARAPTTRARAVARGVEDYYLSGPEAAGEWLGDGPALLGLRGEVGSGALHRVLAGEHPGRGLPLARWNALTENRRQVAQWERDALALLRDGDPGRALRMYEEHRRIAAFE
jgi:hypothetical protein